LVAEVAALIIGTVNGIGASETETSEITGGARGGSAVRAGTVIMAATIGFETLAAGAGLLTSGSTTPI
jgi:hypothetical protein